MERPPCKYGSKCYRKNPDHFREFSHPFQTKDKEKALHLDSMPDLTDVSIESDFGPPSKKIRLENPLELGIEPPASATPPNKGRLFKLTKVRGIQSRYNTDGMALGIKDILSDSLGDLVCSAQFNYLFDVPWLMQQYPESKRKYPILLVYGDQREATVQLRREVKPFPNISLAPAKLEIMFGTHHSKMMFLLYTSGLRVVIHTANLIAKDWDQKTQGVWMSPIFPLLSVAESTASSGCSSSHSAADKATPQASNFKQDLLQYLDVYGGSSLNDWKIHIGNHDMTSARVRLIASVPGAHTGASKHKWGHLKLRKVLSQLVNGSQVDKSWPVVGQFSSIGSLGPASNSWLTAEWLQSLSATITGSRSLGTKDETALKLIFPSVENVQNCLEGYMAGGSIPYSLQNAQKQAYLKLFFCQWKSELNGRSRAAPHIKTYCRLSPDGNKALWFLLTSANLSKAAWGCLEKKGTQLKIRSYEIGVLFLPADNLSETATLFSLTGQKAPTNDKEQDIPLDLIPYDLPLTEYSAADEPWVWNAQYREPDSQGNVWTPP